MADGCLHCRIGAAHTAFARALDHRDVEGWVELFTRDATYANGRVTLRGHDELRAWITERSTAPVRTTRHVWGSLHLGPRDGDELDVISVWTCYAANAPAPVDTVSIWSVADFVDRFRMVDGEWLITSREIRLVFRDPSVAPHV